MLETDLSTGNITKPYYLLFIKKKKRERETRRNESKEKGEKAKPLIKTSPLIWNIYQLLQKK